MGRVAIGAVYEISCSLVTTHMKRTIIASALAFIIAGFSLPGVATAATEEFEISTWIPYWRSVEGVESITPHIDKFTEVHPFFYTVKRSGEVFPNGSLMDAEWKQLRQLADSNGVAFVPTVMWANADAMDDVLRDPDKRQAHIRSIAAEVYRHDLDGIDIDYEAKFARTKDSFSRFLKELNEAIGYDRSIHCTIESRTPLDSRYSSPESIPDDIAYANDFSAINQHCDRVRIMAYDQRRIDLKLNTERGDPYIPIADIDWVEKVMRLAAQEIDPEKLIVGIPTYGHEYDTFTNDNGDLRYSRLWSFNPGYATDIAGQLNITPTRNAAGEISFLFPASQSPEPELPLPNATRVLWWSDAQAIRDKFELAKELGVRGVAIFKVDGGQDPDMWNVLAEHAGTNVEIAASVSGPTPFVPSANLPETDLEFGDRGEGVRLLQQYLNARGFTVAQTGAGSPGNETAFFGPATRNALARFQEANGITPAVGYYGPITRATIQNL